MTTSEPREERVIVAAARRGDVSAFETLARLHSPGLRNLLRCLGASSDDADDALQETWVAAHRALPGYRGDAPIRSWLGRIAVNAYRDIFRAARRILTLPETDRPGETVDPGAALARRETVARVLSAVEELPARQREALLLRVVDGLGYDEIASRMNVGRDAVRMNLVHARRKLLRRFGSEGSES